MPGHHKWSELKSRMTPERRELMAAKTAEIRSMLPPVTYAQVCWAASKYNAGDHQYNTYYRAVYETGYQRALTKRFQRFEDQAPHIRRLRRFLNQWKCHLPDSSDEAIAHAITELGSYQDGLFDSAIEDRILDDSIFDATNSAFNRLTSIPYVGPTIASKILGVLYPRFFVMWDTDIREAYFDRSNLRGREFAIFMKEMRSSAVSIMADSQHRDIADPASAISEQIGQTPPFTLAKFINDYVWLTVTKKERFSLENVA